MAGHGFCFLFCPSEKLRGAGQVVSIWKTMVSICSEEMSSALAAMCSEVSILMEHAQPLSGLSTDHAACMPALHSDSSLPPRVTEAKPVFSPSQLLHACMALGMKPVSILPSVTSPLCPQQRGGESCLFHMQRLLKPSQGGGKDIA